MTRHHTQDEESTVNHIPATVPTIATNPANPANPANPRETYRVHAWTLTGNHGVPLIIQGDSLAPVPQGWKLTEEVGIRWTEEIAAHLEELTGYVADIRDNQ